MRFRRRSLGGSGPGRKVALENNLDQRAFLIAVSSASTSDAILLSTSIRAGALLKRALNGRLAAAPIFVALPSTIARTTHILSQIVLLFFSVFRASVTPPMKFGETRSGTMVLRALPPGALATICKVLISLTAMAVIAAQVDFAFFRSTWHRLSLISVAACLVILASQMTIIAGLRLKLVLKGLGKKCPLFETIKIACCGFFVEQLAFGFVGGDAMRIWLLRELDVSLRTAVEAIALDRFIGLFGLLLLSLIGLPSLINFLHIDRQTIVFASLLILFGVGIALVAILLSFSHLWRNPIFAKIQGLFASILHDIKVRPYQFVILALALTTHLLNVFVFFLIGRDLGLGVSLTEWLLVVPSALLFSMLPISAGGWGLREISFIVVLGSLGVSREEAITPSLIFGLGVLLVALLGGIIWPVNRKLAVARAEKQSSPGPI